MSKPLTREALVRAEWLRRLRSEGDRQCHGVLRDRWQVCALGLLAEAAGIDVDDWCFKVPAKDLETRIGLAAGLHTLQVHWIIRANDGHTGSITGSPPRTFGQIADEVERWF